MKIENRLIQKNKKKVNANSTKSYAYKLIVELFSTTKNYYLPLATLIFKFQKKSEAEEIVSDILYQYKRAKEREKEEDDDSKSGWFLGRNIDGLTTKCFNEIQRHYNNDLKDSSIIITMYDHNKKIKTHELCKIIKPISEASFA